MFYLIASKGHNYYDSTKEFSNYITNAMLDLGKYVQENTFWC